jgi:hypothetical protein
MHWQCKERYEQAIQQSGETETAAGVSEAEKASGQGQEPAEGRAVGLGLTGSYFSLQ